MKRASIENIYARVCEIAEVPADKKAKDLNIAVLKALKKIEAQLKKNQAGHIETNKRINNILKVVQSYAQLNLNKKAFVGKGGNRLDALASGINMLGEELQSSAISLNEKEVLLKEVHHRVKNNLQIISSLLSLQTEHIRDKKLLNFFADNRKRIKSMALVHETLYQSKNIARVDFPLYLQTLVISLREAYYDHKEIAVVLNAESHNLKIDTAIPCGLIINELVTNSYKYAFKNVKSGEIHLQFGKEKSGKLKGNYRLTVYDNGCGLPENFNIKHSSSLGLQLVSMLTEQLDGKLYIDQERGTSFTIVFPG